MPLITLLTDFGDRDPYVGVMKGVIAHICPSARWIDLTHQIPPQDLYAARFHLQVSWRYFPAHTIHLAVVDPGVGSDRRGVAVHSAGGYLVGPDNGIFSGILAESAAIAAVTLDNPAYWRTARPSTTFHGRDIFAPAAAHLAAGVPLAALGSPIDPGSLHRLEFPLPQRSPVANSTQIHLSGQVQSIDQFGNCITTIPGDWVAETTWQVVQVNHIPQQIPGHDTYAAVAPGAIAACVGSHGWVEIAVNQGSAQAQLSIQVGAAIICTTTPG